MTLPDSISVCPVETAITSTAVPAASDTPCKACLLNLIEAVVAPDAFFSTRMLPSATSSTRSTTMSPAAARTDIEPTSTMAETMLALSEAWVSELAAWESGATVMAHSKTLAATYFMVIFILSLYFGVVQQGLAQFVRDEGDGLAGHDQHVAGGQRHHIDHGTGGQRQALGCLCAQLDGGAARFRRAFQHDDDAFAHSFHAGNDHLARRHQHRQRTANHHG